MTKKTASKVERADQETSNKVNQRREGWPMRLVGAISDVADQPQMRLLCGATIAFGMVRGDDRLAKTGLRMLTAHTVATWGKSAVKSVVDRTRPESGDDPEVRIGTSDAHEENSFPSGHTAGAIAVAQAFARGYPEHGLAGRCAAIAVSAIQVPRGTHYLGDVLAGALIGLAGDTVSNATLATVINSADVLKNVDQRR